MITILSPAKTLNMKTAYNTNLYTEPLFIEEASTLIKELRKYSPPEMESLMKINSEFAEENFMRHIIWTEKHDLSNGKQSLLAYDGAVYKGINSNNLDEQQLQFANNHLSIDKFMLL